MIDSAKAVVTNSTDPFYNISLEARLFDVCRKGEVFLYLWHNDNTVVIGKFQNAFKECNVRLLEEEGGHLVRRLTGGGAVYHDVNNLNFSFVAHKEDYDLEKQQTVILEAVRSLGISAEISGRNDITTEGRKFSGNSFLEKGDIKLHNGTVLIDTDAEKMAKYLTVSADKMQSKGVQSVRSRVINLKSIVPALDTRLMADLILKSFGKVYGLPVQKVNESSLGQSKIEKIKTEVFANDAFRFGANPEFSNTVSARFDWGGVEVRYTVKKGVITQAEIFSDALDVDALEQTKAFLSGKNINDLKKFRSDGENRILGDTVGLF